MSIIDLIPYPDAPSRNVRRLHDINEICEENIVNVYELLSTYASNFEVAMLCNLTLPIVADLRYCDQDYWLAISDEYDVPLIYTEAHMAHRILWLERMEIPGYIESVYKYVL